MKRSSGSSAPWERREWSPLEQSCKLDDNQLMRAASNWWEGRRVDDLYVEAPPLIALPIDTADDMDHVASYLIQGGPRIVMMAKQAPSLEPPDGRIPASYWQAVKHEFYVLCCTDDARYEGLRSRLYTYGDKSNAVVVTLIASAFGSRLGFEAGALSGLVAVALTGVVKIGKEAFCTHCAAATTAK